jgi:uncharacterized protein (DUF885 family)
MNSNQAKLLTLIPLMSVRSITSALFAVLAVGACTPAWSRKADASGAAATAQAPLEARRKALADTMNEQWEDNLARHPVEATVFVGDNRWNDQLDDVSLAAIQAELQAKARFRERFAAIDPTGFTDQERLDRELMLWSLDQDLEGARFKGWEMPVDQLDGAHIELPQMPLLVPLGTVKDYEDFVARLRKVPALFDQVTANMRQGVADGLVPPRIVLDKALAQTEAIAAKPPETTAFVTVPVRRIPRGFSDATRARLRSELVDAVTRDVLPAYQRFARFLREEYVQHGRVEPGVWALPDGAERYAYHVRQSTTTGLTPDQIHEIGLQEVARIEREMLGIAKSLGYADLQTFRSAVRDDAKLKARSSQHMLDLYARYIERMRRQLPKLFGRLPSADVKVIAMEDFRAKQGPGAQYQPPSPNGSRPGYVQVNTNDPEKRSVVESEATAYHEGIPGHHMQLAIQQELPNAPPFRRFGMFGNAFVEGWALYAERLGKEIGFYEDPYSDYGRLQLEMQRAIRLVVDTGLHAKRWSRGDVVKFFHDHSTMDEITVVNETDRYIVWPGQALAYKVGELRIRALRERAVRELGSRFDLHAFHDQVLGEGSLPLDVLERRIDSWIAERKALPAR